MTLGKVLVVGTLTMVTVALQVSQPTPAYADPLPCWRASDCAAYCGAGKGMCITDGKAPRGYCQCTQ